MPFAASAAIVGGVAMLGSAAMSSRAANQASAQQAQAAKDAVEEQRRQYDQTRADAAPFLRTGTQANSRLAQLLGIATDDSTGDYGSLLKKFGVSDLNADPVYQSGLQFGLDRGTQGINARATAGGMYDSGATLKALTQFGNDYGSTKANESYNRFNTDQNNIYNRLAGISGTGQVATGQVASAGTNAANSISGSLEGAGNARAAGIVGGANAWGGAISGANSAYNNYQNNQTLQALLRRYNTNTGSTYDPSMFDSFST